MLSFTHFFSLRRFAVLALAAGTSLAGPAARAQSVYITTDLTEVCRWDAAIDEFTDCDLIREQTIYRLSEDESTFIHTAAAGRTSVFKVETKTYDDQTGTWQYGVRSNSGGEYAFILDDKNQLFKIVGMRPGTTKGSYFMISHHIRRMWRDGVAAAASLSDQTTRQ